MAFSRPVACVDGNIRRVMARQTNQEEPSMKDAQTFADNHLFEDSPGTWNQAMMELVLLYVVQGIRYANNVPSRSRAAGYIEHVTFLVRRKPRRHLWSTCASYESMNKDCLIASTPTEWIVCRPMGVKGWKRNWRPKGVNSLVRFAICCRIAN